MMFRLMSFEKLIVKRSDRRHTVTKVCNVLHNTNDKAPCHHGLYSKVAKCHKMALVCIKGEDNELRTYQQTVITLTVVNCHLLPTPTAVSTQSKRAH